MSAPAEQAIRLERIGIVGRRSHEGVAPAMQRILEFATEHGAEVRYDHDNLRDAPLGARLLDLRRERVDLVVALGGDGTLLRAARMTAGMNIPVLGVNLGHLGFLTAAGEDRLEEALEEVAAGRFKLDRRFTLQATIETESGELRGQSFLALNDFVIHKGGVARVTRLDLSVEIEGQEDEIGSFSADGVILATPTGSTAYSMSAGGPIIVPTVECISLTPICPHTLAVRPLVVPATDQVRIRAVDRPEDLVLTVDGQTGQRLDPGDTVVVEKGPVEIQLVRFPGQTFFSTMRRKLNWAIRVSDGE